MTSKTRSIRVHLDEDLYRRVSTHAGALGLSVQRTIIATLAAHVPTYDRRTTPKLGMVSGIDEAIEGGSTSPTPPRTPTSHKVTGDNLDPLLAAAGIAPKKGDPK